MLSSSPQISVLEITERISLFCFPYICQDLMEKISFDAGEEWRYYVEFEVSK